MTVVYALWAVCFALAKIASKGIVENLLINSIIKARVLFKYLFNFLGTDKVEKEIRYFSLGKLV